MGTKLETGKGFTGGASAGGGSSEGVDWNYDQHAYSINKNNGLYNVLRFEYVGSNLNAPIKVASVFSTEDFGEAQEKFKIEVVNSGILGNVHKPINTNL